ncbi:hypothetical protein BV372_06845 [Nostoc sp. T09]|nr:hypothetical protein BV372_06845 [Nostoc sp. T09]
MWASGGIQPHSELGSDHRLFVRDAVARGILKKEVRSGAYPAPPPVRMQDSEAIADLDSWLIVLRARVKVWGGI